MTTAQGLDDIRGYAAAGRVEYTDHALSEMLAAHATFADVRRALANAARATFQTNGRWKVVGPDLEGDELIVVVLIENGLLVVTVF